MKPIKLTENQKQNLMVWACKHGHIAVVRKLIDQEGADVGACDNAALRYASYNGHLEVVRLLVEKGADVGADDNYALCYASEYGHLEVVRLLIDKGADVGACNNYAL